MPAFMILYLLLKGITYVDPDFGKETATIAIISHSFSGCFTSGSDRLTLYRTDTSYFATLQTSDKKNQTFMLNKEQVAGIYSFIQECKDLPVTAGLCTREETYRIRMGDQQFTLTDGTCIWRGFDRLQKLLVPTETIK